MNEKPYTTAATAIHKVTVEDVAGQVDVACGVYDLTDVAFRSTATKRLEGKFLYDSSCRGQQSRRQRRS